MVNIGLIGLGSFGQRYLKTLAELDVHLSYVCQRHAYDSPNYVKGYMDILKDSNVDAVAIVTPAATHYRIVKDSVIARKHVIVEKPFVLSLKEAEELVRLAKKTLMVGYLHMYNPAVVKLKKDLVSFGKINSIKSTVTHNEVSRKDAGALWDLFSHDASIINYLFGYPESIDANGDDETIDIKLKYKDFEIHSHVSWVSDKKIKRFKIYGENKTAEFDDYAKYKLVYDNVPQKLSQEQPLNIELKHFINCVANNKEPLSSASNTMDVMRMLDEVQTKIK